MQLILKKIFVAKFVIQTKMYFQFDAISIIEQKF